jgi:hypothetical protein
MFFRKNGDFRPDTVVKKEIYENKLKAVGITPENTVVFEDRSGVVYMWRTLGFTCFPGSRWRLLRVLDILQRNKFLLCSELCSLTVLLP